MPPAPRRYRLVDSRSRVRVALSGLVIVPLLTILFTVVPVVLLRDMLVGPDVAALVGCACGLVALVGLSTIYVRTWRQLAAVEIRPDGVLVRTDHHLINGGTRRVLVPWPEITGIGVAPADPIDDPEVAGDRAVQDWLDAEGALGCTATGRFRWYTVGFRGRVRVVIGLRARSGAQADEFAARIDELHRLVAGSNLSGPAGTVARVARSLEDWQRRWSSTPQRVGLHVRLRERVLRRDRLDTAVAAFRPGLRVQRLHALSHAELDTPHDIAQMYRSTASSQLSSAG